MKTHYSAIVVGAGQAGLSVSYRLKQRGIDHIVFERSSVASSWRDERWDTFCLVTPNWQCDLPGHPYRGSDPQGFMGRDEIVDYIESYVRAFEPPVKTGVTVLSVEPTPLGAARFRVTTSVGAFTADHVVVATGSYHVPRVPSYSKELAPTVLQVHSAHYRNPESLPPGEVLVVGTGQSGCQIAEDLHLAGRKVHLCVGNAPRCARRHRGKDVVEWLHMMGYYDIPIDRHPNREQVRDRTNHYVTGRGGGRDIDLRKFALEGMQLYGPLRDIQAGVAQFGPGLTRYLDDADDVYRSINRTIDEFIAKKGIDAPMEAPYDPPWAPPEKEVFEADFNARVSAVVWCIGFSADFAWVKAPVFDDSHYPVHERGVTAISGLYFIGLPWLYTWGSGRFSGVGRDATYIVERMQDLSFAGDRSRAAAVAS